MRNNRVPTMEHSGWDADRRAAFAQTLPKTRRPLRVLALASYPADAAATRYRILQFVGPLADREIAVDFRPFLTRKQFGSLYRRRGVARTSLGLLASTLRRAPDLAAGRSVDVVLLQREAMLFGPPVCEYILARLLRKPLVLDLDDATYVPYESPTYGRLAGFIKCFRKTKDLIQWSRVVVCGNRVIEAHAAELGAATVVIPTIVNPETFRPADRSRRTGLPVVGWIGSHSTYRYLESILPALERLGRAFAYRLLVIGSGRAEIHLPGVEVVCRPWRLERELADFQEIDIGLYPIVADTWALGKSGFKAIQYMAMGVPYVVSPVGACAEIGETGLTHYAATTLEEWYAALAGLVGDPILRAQMGAAGRRHAVAQYNLRCQVDKLAHVLRMAAS
jgi:glycosyltransferase involved in cell wall biosynthesis